MKQEIKAIDDAMTHSDENFLARRFAGRDKLIHLVGQGEVMPRLGRSGGDRHHRPVQFGERITDWNQAGLFTLHGFSFSRGYSHSARRAMISCKSALLC